MLHSIELPASSIRMSGTIKLPCLDQAPGPLHTILQDEGGNLYYSDEINHSLVSLSSTGEIRWHRGKPGKGAGEFNYPKGMDLGWIDRSGSKTRCLAVCDSWNRRVQFFAQDGSYLVSWDRVGTESLKEVVDIRFIHPADDARSENCFWLILDRGLHSLLAVDLSGRLKFRTGRALPDNLESRWPLPSDSADLQASPFDLLQTCLPYDPLFMPLRIFGGTEEALFIYEPRSNRLKQAALGNLLPVWLEPPGAAEWIGADQHGLLSFDRDSGSLRFYDTAAQIWQSAKVEGVPIPSARSTKDIWSQDGPLLRHWIYTKERSSAHPWMLCGLPREITSVMQSSFAAAAGEQLQEAAVHLRSLSHRALAYPANQWTDFIFLEKEKKDLSESLQTFSGALSRMREFSLKAFLYLLKLQTLQIIYPSVECREYFLRTADCIKTAFASIAGLFDDMLRFRDEWFLDWLGKKIPGDAASGGIRENALREYYDTWMKAVLELAGWLWFIPFSEAMSAAATKPATLAPIETPPQPFSKSVLSFRPTTIAASPHLREIDRIFVGNHAYVGRVSPAAICYASDLGFLVTLNNSGLIVQLNEMGEVMGPLMQPSTDNSLGKPLGIAIDDGGRIWISRPQAKCIEIFSTGTNQRQILENRDGIPLSLRYPTGLCRISGGQILIADTQNSRIIAATSDGHVTTVVDRKGKNIGEVQHPIAFSGVTGTSEFYVLEIRNHRLQRFGIDGQSTGCFGGPGLGRGQFVLPESVTTFNDGMLAVSQRACTRAIKLFSSDGCELETLFVDYSPWGMLAHKSLLLVCEAFGDHIYVYERA